MDVTNIMISGVGGQGTLLASRVIGHALVAAGLDVKVSEVHGMSQRGGSVVTYVRFGEKVYAPTVAKGEADFLLAFELLEAVRWAEYVKKGGKIIVNTQRIDPMPVITGAAGYPEGIIERLRKAGIDVLPVDALAIAAKAGSERAVNVVLIGVVAGAASLSKELWLDAVRECVPGRFLEVNLAAFEAGWALGGGK